MNRTIPKIGALIATVSVLLFAVCILIAFSFGNETGEEADIYKIVL